MNKEIYYCLINSHNTWHLKMRTPDGKQVLRSTGIKVPEGSKRDIERSKKEAQLKVPKIIDDYKKSKPNHTVVLTDKEDVTLADYAEYYNELNKSNIKITTYDNDKQKINKHIKPYFGKKKLTDITLSDLDKYKKDKLAEGLSANTVGKLLTYIKTVLGYAVKNHIISDNPAEGVKKPKKKKYKYVILSPEELQMLLNAVAGTDMEMPITLAALFGLRRSEVVGLRWSDIDFDGKKITISGTVTRQHNSAGKLVDVYCPGETKTDESQSEYLLTDEVATYLKGKYLAQKAMPRETNEYIDFVCVNEVGQRVHLDYVSDKFSKLLDKFNLPHVRFHDLRHSCISLLVNSHVSMKDAQVYARHANFKTTADTYSHAEKTSTHSSLETITKAIDFKGIAAKAEKTAEDKPKPVSVKPVERNIFLSRDKYSQLADMNDMISGLV